MALVNKFLSDGDSCCNIFGKFIFVSFWNRFKHVNIWQCYLRWKGRQIFKMESFKVLQNNLARWLWLKQRTSLYLKDIQTYPPEKTSNTRFRSIRARLPNCLNLSNYKNHRKDTERFYNKLGCNNDVSNR